MVLIAGLLAMARVLAAAQAPAATPWVGSWAASPQPPSGNAGQANAAEPDLSGRTVRMEVRLSLGGSALRLRFSNAFGASTVVLGAAHVALAGEGSAIVAGSDRGLTFGGAAGIAIPPGGEVISDPVALEAPALARLAVSIFVSAEPTPASWHALARATTYIAGAGNHTADARLPGAQTTSAWYLLSGIDVPTSPGVAGAIVTLGDSITDGVSSSPNQNRRWPDVLAEQVSAAGDARWGVLNQGISGNRLLHDQAGPNALARLDRDVLAQDGARVLIVLDGINDIGWPYLAGGAYASQQVTAAEMIAALRQIADRAHAHGLIVIGATLTPFEGADYYRPQGEAERGAVNEWIRHGGAFDAVLDFDQVTRDPAHPGRLLAAYDSGDHLHPNDAGYAAMGQAAAALAPFRGRQ